MSTPFADFLRQHVSAGPLPTEDVLAAMLPLVRQVIETHGRGRVAPLEGIQHLHVEGGRLWFEAAQALAPRHDTARVRALDVPGSRALDVVEEVRRADGPDAAGGTLDDLLVGGSDTAIARPVYLPGFVSWEHRVGHHDPLTDVFSLGLLLASLACGLDLMDAADVRTFVAARGNLFRLHPGLHPVLGKVILRMTDRFRHRRPPDLPALLRTLESYRELEVELDVELARIPGFREKDARSRRDVVLARLRDRLFEINRQNPLLHFRASLANLNLTYASVPLVLDVASIRAEQLLTWNEGFRRELLAEEPIPLPKYLRFEDAPYLPPVLDRIRVEAQRDLAEFGFESLRLVVCFLRWSDIKQAPPEPYDSPLLLLPVRLTKRKGVRDVFLLQATGSVAEVNPVLRHHLQALYGIALPESVDLSTSSVEALHEVLERQIRATEPGVTLTRIEKPRIDLIHDRARRRLDQYRRRLNLVGAGTRSFGDVTYSYSRENFLPLGFRIFDTRIRPTVVHLNRLLEEVPRPRASMAAREGPATDGDERERTFYAWRAESDGNPYGWELDCCRVTLGSFKYRRISLVRDYDALLEREYDSPAFEAVFSLAPKPPVQAPALPPLAETFPVLACDPTQAVAVAEARRGASHIIQGPPGTGKSQTIANLIADFVARDKRVLFVCEKRAAIDVVYHRLRGVGLHEVAMLVHDAQADKKDVIADLRLTAEAFLAAPAADAPDPERQRDEAVQALHRELAPLEDYERAMASVPADVGVPCAALYERLAELEPDGAGDASPDAPIPPYALVARHREGLARLDAAIRTLRPDGRLAAHPLRALVPGLLREPRPEATIRTRLAAAEAALGRLDAGRRAAGTPAGAGERASTLEALVARARALQPFAAGGHLDLLDGEAPRAARFDAWGAGLRTLRGAHATAQARNEGWRERLAPPDLGRAQALARDFGRRWLPALRPAWWRLRALLRARYRFEVHAMAPRWTEVLDALEAEYRADEACRAAATAGAAEFAIPGDVEAFAARLAPLRVGSAGTDAPADAWQRGLRGVADAPARVAALVAAGEAFDTLAPVLDGLLAGWRTHDWGAIRDGLDGVGESLDALDDFAPCLAELAALPEPLAEACRGIDLTVDGLEAASAREALRGVARRDPAVARFDGRVRARHLRRLAQAHERWLAANAAVVRERVRRRFREHVATAGLPAASLTAERREWKKAYNAGRKELEHEFGKTMRYRPIRELLAGPAGEVMRDLKPVWLMSPLSVSDTLPLVLDAFDVVIFDEASQITLEAAVPTIVRAPQAIVVGDEMQLPPTRFFAAGSGEDEMLEAVEGGEPVAFDLASLSFLNHAARNLPSTMLGWHYRSRSESLISFSNAAFYRGRLLTVPEEVVVSRPREEIRVDGPEAAGGHVERILDRPISLHTMAGGTYQARRNAAEATYIARLVRGLLDRETGLTLGIVAFSEAQQEEIERALRALAREDEPFGRRLEAEFEREVDGHFAGLLVRNLENMQGDERDLVILSVCYGPDPAGKVLMNFGPINQSGGERRLNVALSRAKRHLAIVSSLRPEAITNDHNEGARCLKDYLRYAAAVSAGDDAAAGRVLASRLPDRRDGGERRRHPVALRLADALRGRGWVVALNVGHSHFRCDVAARAAEDPSWRIGILVTAGSELAGPGVLVRDVLQPRLLREFGWRVVQVLARDWIEDRAGCLSQVERALHGEPDPAEAEPEDAPAAARADAPAAPPVAPGRTRRFEFVGDGSNKFWEITVADRQYSVRFGRIGTTGQELVRTFDDAGTARHDADARIEEKLAKGYRETTGA